MVKTLPARPGAGIGIIGIKLSDEYKLKDEKGNVIPHVMNKIKKKQESQ